MKVLVGLLLVGCGLGIVGIQGFGNPAEWATTIPADLPQLGLAVISALALVVGGMVMTPSGAAIQELPELPAPKTSARLSISEPVDVLSLDEDEEAARRRARRAAKRKKARAAAKAAAAAADSGSDVEEPRRRKRSRSSSERSSTKKRRSKSGSTERPRKRKRTREHAISGRA